MSVVPNLEEAGAIAAEYISSLDNLPNEVQFLLAEIKHKETKSQELQHEIHKETSKYIKQCLRSSTQSPSAPSPSPQTPNPSQPPNSTALSAKVASSYAVLDQLASEKVALAKRMADLIARAKARLDYDLARVLVAQGDADAVSASATAAAAAAGATYSWAAGQAAAKGGGGAGVATGRNSAIKDLNERLTAIIALPEVPNMSGAVTTPLPKRRKLTAQASTTAIRLPSPSPSIPPITPQSTPTLGRPSRFSHQIHIPSRGRRATASTVKLEQKEEEEEDAEGEEDVEAEAEGEGGEAEEEGEDKELYCFCQKMSYGEMIGCDNSKCPYQWFHLSCVNLKPPLPDVWFCDECIKRGFAHPGYERTDMNQQHAGPGRKRGRK